MKKSIPPLLVGTLWVLRNPGFLPIWPIWHIKVWNFQNGQNSPFAGPPSMCMYMKNFRSTQDLCIPHGSTKTPQEIGRSILKCGAAQNELGPVDFAL